MSEPSWRAQNACPPAIEVYCARATLKPAGVRVSTHVSRRRRSVGGAPSGENTTAAYVYARAGQKAEALRYLRLLESEPDASPYLSAGEYLALGDRQRALGLLEKSIQARDDFAADAAIDPTFTALRNEPRFQQLLAEAGLK